MRYSELFEEVTLSQQTIPVEMLDAANDDPFLKGFVDASDANRLGIEVDNELVGFMTPRFAHGAWRTGAIYIMPEHRNKGLASSAIRRFFADKENGVALVEPRNAASRRAYTNAGFKVSKRIKVDGEEYDVMKKI